MPRYMVQRTFPQGLEIPVADGGAEICRTVGRRYLGPLVRERRQAHHVLHLRRAHARGDPQDRHSERPACRSHHTGASTRSLLLLLTVHDGNTSRRKEHPCVV